MLKKLNCWVEKFYVTFRTTITRFIWSLFTQVFSCRPFQNFFTVCMKPLPATLNAHLDPFSSSIWKNLFFCQSQEISQDWLQHTSSTTCQKNNPLNVPYIVFLHYPTCTTNLPDNTRLITREVSTKDFLHGIFEIDPDTYCTGITKCTDMKISTWKRDRK